MTMVPWARGRAGAAASSSEALTSVKYADHATTHTFIPLAFETLGSWGDHARRFVAELGRRTSAVTGDRCESAILRQRISVAVPRGNALACAETLGPSQGLLPRMD